MKVTTPCSIEQELLVEEHLLRGKQLFVAPSERQRLISWVQRHHPGHKVVGAELDLETVTWKLDLQAVTVTT